MGLGDETTQVILESLVVHETEEYYLVEVTTAAARRRVSREASLVERAIALFYTHPNFHVTEEMDAAQRDSLAEASAAVSETHPWSERPSTGNWSPRLHNTDEFERVAGPQADEADSSSGRRQTVPSLPAQTLRRHPVHDVD